MLYAHAEPNQPVGDAQALADRRGDARVRHDRGVLDERLHATEALGEREQLAALEHPGRALEPAAHDHADHAAEAARLTRGERVRRHLTLATGAVQLEDGGSADELLLTDTTLTTHHGPSWRLLLIGAGQMTQYLAQMAQALGYQVLVCDPREEYATGFDVPGATLLRTMPDDTVTALVPDGHTAIIALTHDPKLDDLALLEALKSPAFYVGAIGSRLNQSKRKQRLKEHFDMNDAQLARLHGPVGLKNGARTPPEIAVSILAELTAVRYGFRVPEPVPVQPQAAVEAGCVLPG